MSPGSDPSWAGNRSMVSTWHQPSFFLSKALLPFVFLTCPDPQTAYCKNQTKEPTPQGKTNGSVLPFPTEEGIFYSQVEIQQQSAMKNISLFPQEMKPGKLTAPECFLKMIRFMIQPTFSQKQCLKGSDIWQCDDEFISALTNDI